MHTMHIYYNIWLFSLQTTCDYNRHTYILVYRTSDYILIFKKESEIMHRDFQASNTLRLQKV